MTAPKLLSATGLGEVAPGQEFDQPSSARAFVSVFEKIEQTFRDYERAHFEKIAANPNLADKVTTKEAQYALAGLLVPFARNDGANGGSLDKPRERESIINLVNFHAAETALADFAHKQPEHEIVKSGEVEKALDYVQRKAESYLEEKRGKFFDYAAKTRHAVNAALLAPDRNPTNKAIAALITQDAANKAGYDAFTDICTATNMNPDTISNHLEQATRFLGHYSGAYRQGRIPETVSGQARVVTVGIDRAKFFLQDAQEYFSDLVRKKGSIAQEDIDDFFAYAKQSPPAAITMSLVEQPAENPAQVAVSDNREPAVEEADLPAIDTATRRASVAKEIAKPKDGAKVSVISAFLEEESEPEEITSLVAPKPNNSGKVSVRGKVKGKVLRELRQASQLHAAGLDDDDLDPRLAAQADKFLE